MVSHNLLLIFSVAASYQMLVSIHDPTDNLIVKWFLTIKCMLICDRISFVNSLVTFHMVSKNARFGQMFLLYEWLDDNVKSIAPKVVYFTHENVCSIK